MLPLFVAAASSIESVLVTLVGMMSSGKPRTWSLARQLFALQVLVVLAVVLAGGLAAYLNAQRQTEDSARRAVTDVAATVASTPTVLSGVREPQPSTVLQPFAEAVRGRTGVDFITIMDTSGTRYTHPNPAVIGQRFIGNIADAVRGSTFTETYTGTLGPSVRVVAPIVDSSHGVVALVSVGIKVSTIADTLRGQIGWLLASAALALLLGGLATYLVNARLRRHTHGLGPMELTRMYEYHDAILHAVREGLLLVGPDGVVTMCNDGAARLLRISASDAGRRVPELGFPQSLSSALTSADGRRDELHLTDDRVLLLNTSRVRSGRRDLGNVVTIRDHTELQALTGELDSVRGFAESLRSQTHESANRLHTVVSLIELGKPDEAVRFATAELTSAQRLTDDVVAAVTEPVLAALLLGKITEARERGVALTLTPDSGIDEHAAAGLPEEAELVTILGNLIDNAIDAAADSPESTVWVTVTSTAGELLLRVADSGPGLDPALREFAFRRGWSTKGGPGLDGRGLGLALVGQAVRRNRGGIEVDHDLDGGASGAVFTVRLPIAEVRS